MPTEILRPAGVGNYGNLGATGSGVDWEQVDEAVADNDTYVFRSAGRAYSDFKLQATALTSETINSVDTWQRSRSSGSGTTRTGQLWFTFNDIAYTNGSLHTLSGSYANYEDTGVARPGGGSWVPGDFGGTGAGEIIFGVELEGAGGYEARCTQMYVEINYTAGASPVTESMAAMTASAAVPSATTAVKASMSVQAATAEALAPTASLKAAMAASTASAEALSLTGSLVASMAANTADAAMLSASPPSVGALMGLAAADAALLDATLALAAAMSAKTASAEQLAATAALVALMEAAAATAEHLALTVEAPGEVAESMGLMTADASLLAATASIVAAMGLQAASAEHLSLTAPIVVLMGLATADGAALAPTVSLVALMTSSPAGAELLTITSSLIALMGAKQATALLLALALGGQAAAADFYFVGTEQDFRLEALMRSLRLSGSLPAQRFLLKGDE